MADWVWVESEGATLSETPRLKTASFGDGYEQRAPAGINFVRQAWDIPFNGVDDAVADDMVAFLRQQAGYLPFNYVPLRSTTALRVICRSWTRTHSAPGESTLRCKFETVYEP